MESRERRQQGENMNILISTLGSRGDIQPFVALGKGLKAAGYRVAICTAEGFRPFIEEQGVEYAYMNNKFLQFMQAQAGQAAMEGSGNMLELIRIFKPILRQTLEDEWQAALTFQPDLLIYHPKTLGSYHVAEKLKIPAFLSLPLPFYTPTQAFPNPLFGNLRLGGWVNRLSYAPMAWSTAMYAGQTNEFRVQTLGLPPRSRFANMLVDAHGQPVPVLYPYSPQVLPVPADFPPHVHVTGYWFLDHDEAWQPSPALMDFLAAGPPPVYVGFGSMGGQKAAQRAEIVLGALARSGQRGLIASGWGGLHAEDLPETVFLIESAPHDWLFPQVAAVVHHGGAGTTAAGLRAGKPTVICPFIADQPFWGRVVHELGVGPKPIPQKKLAVEKLAAAISAAVGDPQMVQRAADLGGKIRNEDGIAHAIAMIEHAVRQPAMAA
jgi:sterol 3beta-glucosyltransferase